MADEPPTNTNEPDKGDESGEPEAPADQPQETTENTEVEPSEEAAPAEKEEAEVDVSKPEEIPADTGTDEVKPEEATTEPAPEAESDVAKAEESLTEQAPNAEGGEVKPEEANAEETPTEQAPDEAQGEPTTDETPLEPIEAPGNEETPGEATDGKEEVQADTVDVPEATEPQEGKEEREGEVKDQDGTAAEEQQVEAQESEQVPDDKENAAQDNTAEQETDKATTEVTEKPSGESAPTEPELQPQATPEVPAETEPTVEVLTREPIPPVEDAHATVKFVLMPSSQVATLRCKLRQTLAELKEHFAAELKIPPSMILLMFAGDNMDDNTTLAGLGVGPNGTVQLEMQSADPVNTPLKGFKPRQEYHMPDVITVRVESEEGFKDVVVEITRATKKKTFIGGYRHKKTNIEYYHAAAQTNQKPPPPATVTKFCRDTQTVQQQHIVQQTTNEMSTQMTGVGVYVSNMTDELKIPGPYTTAEQHKSMVLARVIVIQKYYRRWLAKRFVEQIRDDKQSRLEWEREQELKKKKEKEDRIRREFERRMNPKTKEDFDLLYSALENWRQEEVTNINNSLTGAERKAALYALLEQETQLIASVGRHKIAAETENKEQRVQKFLEKAAAPKRWKGPDGKYTEMDTPYTIRAKELLEIYNSICMRYLTQDERLDVLLTLKHTVKEHDCKLTQEIIELIDREADLLMRGVKETNLEGLRKRIATLFLQYIKTPTFNPEIARLLKVPQDPTILKKNIYFCTSCNQYLQSTEFQLSSNSKAVGKCRKCSKMDNEARGRQDYSHYRYMLKSLRRSEAAFGEESKIAFLLQENDLRYMVENIWNSQSALSAWDDLYDLVLVRWYRQEEWSPWNCILLTKEEASAHEKLEDLEEGYGKNFIHSIRHKHTLARNYFSRLPGMAEQMRESSTAGLEIQSTPAVQGQAVPVAAK